MNVFQESKNVFIIAEAGSNWKCGTYEEDLEQAKKLINVASEAGANAVKFQTYKPETIYVENAGSSNYLSEHGINHSINEIFENLSMPYKMIPELRKYCDQKKSCLCQHHFLYKMLKKLIHLLRFIRLHHLRLIM